MLEKKKLRLVKKLGLQVRERVKKLNREVLGLGLCWNYNLQGGCLMASYMLRYVLDKHGVSSKLMRGEFNGCYHWWIEVDDYIVDITATQFGNRNKVYILKNTSVRYVGKQHRSLKFQRWDREFWPTRYHKFFGVLA